MPVRRAGSGQGIDGQSLRQGYVQTGSSRAATFARHGDMVVVHSMDRLARNLDDLPALVQVLTRKGVRVEFLKENPDFTGEDSPMANLKLSVMGAFAEF